MKNIILLFFLILLCQSLFAQTIKGKIIDSAGKALVYANVGIPLKNKGTISNIEGEFNLIIDKSNYEDTIFLSMLGYETYQVPIRNILNSNSPILIQLKAITYIIDEVVIKPLKYNYKEFGNKFQNRSRLAGFVSNKLGNEIGVVMKNNKKGIINFVSFIIGRCTYDTLFLRLNIYNFEKEKVLNSIMKRPYYINISKNEINDNEGKIKLDLSELNLKVSGNFLVCFETVINYDEPDGFLFCDGIYSNSPTYSRETSFGKWYKGLFNVSINSTVKYEK